jgi:hypothetical protein
MRVAALLLQGLTFGLVAGVLHCGGATDSLGTPPGDDVGNEAGPPVGEVPAQHRPAAVACASSSAGGVACNDDAECNGNTPGLTPNHCLHGTCGPDDCTTDADCPTGGVCSCDGATRTYSGASANACVAGDCRVDADCGPGGYCSPTVSSSCGGFYGVQGYYCHRRGDACMNDSDCGTSGTGPGGVPYCAYDPSVGRWACETGFCAG